MIATILIIFFTQYMHLFAMPNPEPNPGACVLSVNAVSMILYTRDIPDGKNIGIQECCENLNSSQPIVFLVHGFISTANLTRFQELASRMIETGRVVFALDWSQAACYNKLPTFTRYASAVKNTRAIGSHMAKYIFDPPIVVCSHSRSIDYVIDVLDDDCGFPAVPIKRKLHFWESAPSYPTSDTEDCIIINSKILNSNNSLTGHYYGFVKGKDPHCVMNSQQVFKCQQQ
ncbi:phospholipase A1-like [Pogonomyrmex barbatus]|uniref:Phospholipase A1-like n=1 Tax=Pogonomyrmex barbatus TaxID=144034 RepID=A0A6I9XIN2_9HYME|nr:phospholipase A1-like [Pogonomyrmex barbatus]